MDAPLLTSERIHKIAISIEYNPKDQWTKLGFGRVSYANSQEKVHLWTTNATPIIGQKWTFRRLYDRNYRVDNNRTLQERFSNAKLRYVASSRQNSDPQYIYLGEEFQRSLEDQIMVKNIWDILVEGEESTRKYLESLSPERLQVEINKYGPIDTLWEDLTPLIWAARLVTMQL
jgi:hypothetical protein